MNQFHRFTLLVLITILPAFFAVAQTDFRKGYVVPLDNDTIPGWVDYRGAQRNSKVCNFRKTENGESESYTPQELRGYGVSGGRAYESKDVTIDSLTRKRLFLEILVKGKASLFYYKSNDEDHYLVDVNNEGVNELVKKTMIVERDGVKYSSTTKAYIGMLKYLLADCNRINPLIELCDLQEANLVQVIQQYNQCMASGGELYKPYQPSVSFRLGAKLGVLSASAYFPGGSDSPLELGNYNAPRSLTFGGFMTVLFPRVSEKLSLQIEALYTKNKYDTYKEFKDPYRITRSKIQMNVSYVKVPLLLQYTYPKGKLRPFIQVGAYMAFVLQANGSRRNEVESIYTHAIDTDEQEVFRFKKSQAGFFAGLGTRYVLNRKLFLLVEARIEQGNGLDYQIGVNTSRSKVNYGSLMVGIGF